MKVLILLSMIIVFISVTFILFVLSDITNKYMDCFKDEENNTVCSIAEFGLPFVVGLIIISLFVMIDAVIIYFLFSTLASKGNLSYAAKSL